MAQPISAAPGQPYGERKKQEQAQALAPMASGRPLPDPFGPSQRPDEPPTSGMPFGPGPGPAPMLAGNPDVLLAEAARLFPHPDLLRLLARRGGV